MSEQAKLPDGVERWSPGTVDPDGPFIQIRDLHKVIAQRDSEWRSGLLGDEAKRAAASEWDAAHAKKLAQFMQSVRPGEVAQPMENPDIAGTALSAAIDKGAPDGGEGE